MAISITNVLEEGQNTDLTTYTTVATLPVVAGRLYLATLTVAIGSGTPTTTLTIQGGTGITFTEIATRLWNADTKRLTLFRGVATATVTDELVVTGSAALIGMQLLVEEVTVADTGGTNGSNAIVQTVTTGTTTVTMATFADAANSLYAGFGGTTNGAAVAGTNFTELGSLASGNPNRNTISIWNDDGSDLTADVTNTGTTAVIGVEIKAAAAGGHGPLLGRDRLRMVRP